MKHPTRVEKYLGDSKELARDEGRMRYDFLATHYGYKADDFIKQAEADRERGNIQLAKQLELIAQELYKIKYRLKNTIWEKICKKHINH